MLEPGGRVLLWDSVEPPPGYEFAEAVGTSFTVDLLGLASLPLALAFRSLTDSEDNGRADPLAMLEALRRHGERITLFCQAGQIKVPPHDQLVHTQLEPSIVQVGAPHGGVFHPKVWALKFTAPDGPTRYRLLVLSRNLTFDRSWDIALRLDGEVASSPNAIPENRPLSDFVAALPTLALEAPTEDVRARCARVAADLGRADFELPDGVEELVFWPLGIDGHRGSPFEESRIDRMLLMAPFMDETTVADLTSEADDVVVSRAEQLDELGADALSGRSTKVLSEGADFSEPGSEQSPEELRGLHAKLFLADAGWRASAWVGSANATTAAFQRNVEFLVQLTGKKGQLGIERLLGTADDQERFGAILENYPPATYPVPIGPEGGLERELERFLSSLAASDLSARVELADGGRYSVRLEGEPPRRPGDLEVLAWPATTRREIAALEVRPGELPTFSGLALESVTAFFGFRAVLRDGDHRVSKDCLIKLPLLDEPEGRQEAVLRSMMRNARDLMRYLLLLLEDDIDPTSGGDPGEPRGRDVGDDDPIAAWLAGRPLFELLVRAASRSPERLDRVARLIDDLRSDPEGRQVIPEELEQVLGPVLASREGVA